MRIRFILDTKLFWELMAYIWSQGRLTILLFILILTSAYGVLSITQKSREIITQNNELLQAREALDDEWRHLLLEEHALSEHSRIQNIAEKELNMHRPSNEQERVIEQ